MATKTANVQVAATPKPKTAQVKILSISDEIKTKSNGNEYQTGIGYCEALKSNVAIMRTIKDDKRAMEPSDLNRPVEAILSKSEDGTAIFAEVSLRTILSDEALALFEAL